MTNKAETDCMLEPLVPGSVADLIEPNSCHIFPSPQSRSKSRLELHGLNMFKSESEFCPFFFVIVPAFITIKSFFKGKSGFTGTPPNCLV